jgi:hypothetical protein
VRLLKSGAVELAQRVLQPVAKHKHSHFLFAGDESWMLYAHNRRTKWAASWDDAEEIERQAPFQQMTMLAIFFNGTGQYSIATLSAGQRVNGAYFVEYVHVLLTEVCSPEGRKPHERRVMVHFDSAPIHSIEVGEKRLAKFGIHENGTCAL